MVKIMAYFMLHIFATMQKLNEWMQALCCDFAFKRHEIVLEKKWRNTLPWFCYQAAENRVAWSVLSEKLLNGGGNLKIIETLHIIVINKKLIFFNHI